ncbi:hypothetical protein LXL04_008403 [Taraxacum kok-saghyz]
MITISSCGTVTSHFTASVALSVRGWVGAWPGLVDGESGRAGLCDLGGLDSGCLRAYPTFPLSVAGTSTDRGKAKA